MFRKRNKITNIFKKKEQTKDIDPDEIFLDSSNLPEFDVDQFEGRIERPIPKRIGSYLLGAFLVLVLIFSGRAGYLQVAQGDEFGERSENNRLDKEIVFPERGVFYDRENKELAWNEINPENTDFSKRVYISDDGFSHLLGFIDYPSKDSSGFYYEENIQGLSGVEKAFQEKVGGEGGTLLTELSATGEIKSKSLTQRPKAGHDIILSIDKDIQKKLYSLIRERATDSGFSGGAGLIMNVETGEIIAMTSYPEFDSNIMAEGENRGAISSYNTDPRKPFLNRAISGLYAPGSIIKPFIALAGLEENIITPEKEIESKGLISVPNPYFPDKPTIFRDWKAHGYTDMREAIAVSSDVYFYALGGGYQDQIGLGIKRIEEYIRMFGFGSKSGISIEGEAEGVIPNPEWKKEVFDGEEWILGNTYHTSIGQYGFQITPIQALRAVSSIANGGYLISPVLEKTNSKQTGERLPFSKTDIEVVKEGMRLAVTNGTASGISVPYIKLAAKTGTAEVGISKLSVNSWIIGFWPYENPKYAFTVVMEKGPTSNLIGSVWVTRQLFDWIYIYKKDFLE